MKCVQCDSINIVRNVQILDHSYGTVTNLKAAVKKRPKAMFFKNSQTADIHGNICVDCGFVMLAVSTGAAKRLQDAKSIRERT